MHILFLFEDLQSGCSSLKCLTVLINMNKYMYNDYNTWIIYLECLDNLFFIITYTI